MTSDTVEHAKAVRVLAALKEVNELRIPVVCRDRFIPRKEQARLARELFKKLGIKGVGVRVSTGAKCITVHVRVPQMIHAACPPGEKWSQHDTKACEACIYRRYALDKLAEILGRAFPQHDDRSDSQSDYFDFKWFIY